MQEKLKDYNRISLRLNNTGHQSILPPDPCGGSSLHATNESQVLQSPGYPNQYPVSTRCRWIISAPEESDAIHLEIDEMHLEASSLCSKDRLFISDYVPVGKLASSLLHTHTHTHTYTYKILIFFFTLKGYWLRDNKNTFKKIPLVAKPCKEDIRRNTSKNINS